MDAILKTIKCDILNWSINRPAFLDVRAPVEFSQGHLPGAFNLPLLNDEERALVGTCYKQKGQASAIELGHQLVSGDIRLQRIESWKNAVKKNPQIILYCFRGGLRSRTTQEWLSSLGIEIVRLEGGYKEARSQILKNLEELSLKENLILISGPTGSGKTHFLKKLKNQWPQVDLEERAKHKGSAFGRLKIPQPNQALFENLLVFDWLDQKNKFNQFQLPLALEDESRLIGRVAVPDNLFSKMRQSPVIWLEVDIEDRVSQIFYDYIENSEIVTSMDEKKGLQIYQDFKKSLQDIQKRLGGARTSEILNDIETSEKQWLQSKTSIQKLELESNRVWIKKLLSYYYDPMYLGSLEKRSPSVYFRGSTEAAFAFLLEEKNKMSAIPVKTKALTD